MYICICKFASFYVSTTYSRIIYSLFLWQYFRFIEHWWKLTNWKVVNFLPLDVNSYRSCFLQEQVKFCHQCIVTSLESKSENTASQHYGNYPGLQSAYMWRYNCQIITSIFLTWDDVVTNWISETYAEKSKLWFVFTLTSSENKLKTMW